MQPADNRKPLIAADELRQLVEAGLSNDLIAEYFGVEKRYVQACLMTYRLIGIRKRGPIPHPSPELNLRVDREALTRLIAEKKTNKEIAALFGVKTAEVQNCVKVCGLIGIRKRGPNRPGNDARLEDIKAMRLNLATLDGIAQKYDLTRERVRQILSAAIKADPAFGVAFWERKAQQRLERAGKKKLPKFRAAMLDWLHWAGYQYCPTCITVKCELDFSPSFQGRNGLLCKRCNTDRHMVQYHKPNSNTRKYDDWYRKAHPETQRRAQKKYHKKHHKRIEAQKRERMKSDPEYKARRNKYVRDYYQRCKERAKVDPVYAEVLRQRGKKAKANQRVRKTLRRNRKTNENN